MSSYLISKEMGKMRSKKIILFAIAVSLITSIALASPSPLIEWKKVLDGGFGKNDYFMSVQQTLNSENINDGYIMTGYKTLSNSDVWLFRTDLDGNTIFDYKFGGNGNDHGYSIAPTSDGGYIITGDETPNGSLDVCLIKIDSKGQLEKDSKGQPFNHTFGGSGNDRGWSVQQTSDGYIVAGYTSSFGNGYDAWLIKTDPKGNEIWDKTFGGTGNDSASSVCQVSGGYLIAGYTSSFGNGNSDAWLIKTDLDGNEIWNRTFGGTGNDSASSVCQVSGGYLIAGYTNSFGNGNWYSDAWLIKTNLEGNELWDVTFGGAVNDSASSVCQVSGGYLIAGNTTSFGNGNSDAWLIKTDLEGNKIWDLTYGGSGKDQGYSAIGTADGKYILVGYITNSGTDGFIIKVGEKEDAKPPIAEAGGPYSGNEGSPISFDASGSSDPDGKSLQYRWYFSDKDGWTDWSDSPTISYTWLDDWEGTVKLEVSNGKLTGTDTAAVKVIISATIDIDPDTINKKSGGQWVTVYIELPAEYDVKNIDPKTVMINDKVPPVMDPKYGFVSSENDYITDVDNDGIPERMFKFNRSDVASTLDTGDSVLVTLIGGVKYKNEFDSDLADFGGTDTIKVMDKGKSIATRVDGNISFAALSPYPQPCNPEVWIPYTLGQDVDVKIRIYNDRGQLIRILNLGHQAAGLYLNRDKSAHWDGKNESGEEVSSGIYFYIIRAGDFVTTKKFVIIR